MDDEDGDHTQQRQKPKPTHVRQTQKQMSSILAAVSGDTLSRCS